MDSAFEILFSGQQYKRLYEKKCHLIFEKYGLTKVEIEILLFLENNKQYDTAKDVVDLKFFAKSHVSKAISSLITRGLLYSEADEFDRRCVHLKISDEAKPVIGEAKKMREELLTIIYNGISDEEKEVMFNIADKILGNIKEAIEKED
ncbi:MarR family winged helix-turn-helix transcriptional regulator [Desulfuribacillus alkaliarsenatis]|uniref:HTH marR-type domain-containing protein n=1 Tax=Desulfuribacillus alkaliarsenatis TaxID=766136 RepID=A0A1E5G275_9FIRM|nr:winged helix DNA-binding protein [Desulfuribacillus alkaliarsenatis]OEF97080.1 hypothetical protein BHF68_05635 [Desulfuribacillus alkaliarsenatis]